MTDGRMSVRNLALLLCHQVLNILAYLRSSNSNTKFCHHFLML